MCSLRPHDPSGRCGSGRAGGHSHSHLGQRVLGAGGGPHQVDDQGMQGARRAEAGKEKIEVEHSHARLSHNLEPLPGTYLRARLALPAVMLPSCRIEG
eukprot:scaffold32277_cov108-Isochrysis_galbana.AAC.3